MQIILFLLFFFTYSPVNAATMVVSNGFESGNLNGLNCIGNCPALSTSIVNSGSRSGNFDLTRSMTTSYRTEVEPAAPAKFFNFGQEYWVGFNYRYENWAKDSSAEIAPMAIHARASDWSAACNLGPAIGSGPFNVLSQNDEMRVFTYGAKVLWSTPVVKNKWLSLVVHFIASSGPNGLIEVWKDGVKVGRVNGANSPALDKCNKPLRTPYLNLGVYKWDWRPGRAATQSTRRQILIDNVKIAAGADGYALVSMPMTLPVISNIQATVAHSAAVITWTSSEATTGLINYGPTPDYGQSIAAPLSPLTTAHSLTLAGLPANAPIHYQIRSTNAAGQTGVSDDRQALISDPLPPAISTILISAAQVTISWITDKPTTGEIDYGADNHYGLTAVDTTLATQHAVTLQLIAGKPYHYRISSTDASGTVKHGDDLTL